MPLYDYKCRATGERFSRFAPMVESSAPRSCACGMIGDRVISPTRITRDYEGYQCPVTEQWIEGRAAHEENLKRTGSRLFEPGEHQSRIAQREREEADFDRAIEQTVEREIEAMPSAKKEALTNELTRGADVAVERI